MILVVGASGVLARAVGRQLTQQSFNPQQLQREYPVPLTRVEDFIREQITVSAGAAAC